MIYLVVVQESFPNQNWRQAFPNRKSRSRKHEFRNKLLNIFSELKFQTSPVQSRPHGLYNQGRKQHVQWGEEGFSFKYSIIFITITTIIKGSSNMFNEVSKKFFQIFYHGHHRHHHHYYHRHYHHQECKQHVHMVCVLNDWFAGNRLRFLPKWTWWV